jgi:Domain of unknown function (DUF6532)
MIAHQLQVEREDAESCKSNLHLLTNFFTHLTLTAIATHHDSTEPPYDLPDAHLTTETKPKETFERKRKETPTTTSLETTVVTKRIKVEGSGSRGRIRTADFNELTRSIIEETISIYRAQISSVEPFPERTDDRDTVKQAWLEVCTARNLRVELEEDIYKLVCHYYMISSLHCNDLSLQIVGRASQARGYAKTTSRPYFLSAYKIDSQGSKREIRDVVEQLLEGGRFIYKVCGIALFHFLITTNHNDDLHFYKRWQDSATKKGIFRAPLIQTIINKVWFKNREDDGVIHPEFSENEALPLATIAFVLTVVSTRFPIRISGTRLSFLTRIHDFQQIENNFDEWVTGEHVDVPFTATAYKAKYRCHLKRIMEFEKKTREEEIVPRLLRHMLKAARCVTYLTGTAAITYFTF